MANEKKLIPILGKQLEATVNSFVLRLLILVYYPLIISLIIIGFSEDNARTRWLAANPGRESGSDLMAYVLGAVLVSLLFWPVVYFLSKLLIWLFTGSAAKN